MAERESFVANGSPWRMLAALAACAGFVALGSWIWRQGGIEARIIGALSVLTFGTFALLGARKVLRTGPVLRIDARGIWWRDWSDRPVPWSAVAAADEVVVHRQRFLAVHLHDPERYRPDGAGRSARLNSALGFGNMALSTAGTDRRFAELRAAVARFGPRASD